MTTVLGARENGAPDALAGLWGALFAALPRPVLLIEGEGQIVFVNAQAEEFFQMGAGLMKKRIIADLAPYASPLLALVEKVQRQGWTVHEHGLDLTTPRTGERKADVIGAPVPERPGACLLLLEERAVATTLDRQLLHRGAARSLAGMAAVLAHEIKNPLAGIKGAAQLIDGVVPEAERALPNLICQEADRIANLVDRMGSLGATRMFERRPVNIHDVLDHVHRLAASSFAAGIAFLEEYDPSLPPVHGDRDRLVQVLLNLVRNAADALQGTDEPRIRLTTAFRPGVKVMSSANRERLSLPLEVTVADNGPGIDPDLLPHLFDPFVTTKPGGTGLGLALVAKIIDEHGGVVDCTSRPGETVFRMLLPIDQHTEPEPAPKRRG